jgi:cysteine desulfurase/selenocysteine lyase
MRKKMDDFDTYRSEFPITKTCCFMNHAAVSPPPVRVTRAVESLMAEFGSFEVDHYARWMKRVAEVRHLFARLIQGSPDEIAFIGNTSEGLGTVAAGLEWKAGDGVLVPMPEFPANVYPWMNLERQGVEVKFIPRKNGRFGVEAVDKALDPGSRLLSVSSVDFSTGFRCDLEALGDFCKRKGLLFCVDAIQSLGLIHMDVKKYGIHFLAAAGHKWLLSTMGCGGLYISEAVKDRIHPGRVGWKSVVHEEDFFHLHFDLKPDARRFETGTLNLPGIYALGAAIGLLLDAGIEKIFERVLALNDLLIRGLEGRRVQIATPMGKEERSGILSFIPLADPKALYKFLSQKRVAVSLRENMIRLSPHFYNNGEDVAAFFDAMDQFSEWK